MNQESKDLLFQDLCARLPYGVKYSCIDIKNVWRLKTIFTRSDNSIFCDGCNDLELCRPYLFPLSSMTEEQRNELKNLLRPSVLKSLDEDDEDNENIEFPTLISANPSVVEIDYYNKNHFDYRNLINKNLAIDCTNLNIY